MKEYIEIKEYEKNKAAEKRFVDLHPEFTVGCEAVKYVVEKPNASNVLLNDLSEAVVVDNAYSVNAFHISANFLANLIGVGNRHVMYAATKLSFRAVTYFTWAILASLWNESGQALCTRDKKALGCLQSFYVTENPKRIPSESCPAFHLQEEMVGIVGLRVSSLENLRKTPIRAI